MSAQVCLECTAAYSVGAPLCPECGTPAPRGEQTGARVQAVRCPGQECPNYGLVRRVPLRSPAPGVVERPPLHCAECGRALEYVTDEEQEEQSMPKVTQHTGPSIEGPETQVEMANGDLVTIPEDPGYTDETEGGEGSSLAGTTSSTSSERESTSPETSESDSPKPAPTTGSRSRRARTGSSSASGTDGGQTAPSSASDKDSSGTSDTA